MESKPKQIFNVFSADRCDPVSIIANAEPNTTLVDAGTVVEYDCNTGHVFKASVIQYTIVCQNMKSGITVKSVVKVYTILIILVTINSLYINLVLSECARMWNK